MHLPSHDLPNQNFWEGKTLLFCRKHLKRLVGAAGFEPTTCSTQNCRATRLRYTPNVRRAPSIHASQGASKLPSRLASLARPPTRRMTPRPLFPALFAAEQRVADAVAGADAVFLRRARRHLQNG